MQLILKMYTNFLYMNKYWEIFNQKKMPLFIQKKLFYKDYF